MNRLDAPHQIPETAADPDRPLHRTFLATLTWLHYSQWQRMALIPTWLIWVWLALTSCSDSLRRMPSASTRAPLSPNRFSDMFRGDPCSAAPWPRGQPNPHMLVEVLDMVTPQPERAERPAVTDGIARIQLGRAALQPFSRAGHIEMELLMLFSGLCFAIPENSFATGSLSLQFAGRAPRDRGIPRKISAESTGSAMLITLRRVSVSSRAIFSAPRAQCRFHHVEPVVARSTSIISRAHSKIAPLALMRSFPSPQAASLEYLRCSRHDD